MNTLSPYLGIYLVIKLRMSLLYTFILSLFSAILVIFSISFILSKRTSNFQLPDWEYPPIGPAVSMPE